MDQCALINVLAMEIASTIVAIAGWDIMEMTVVLVSDM